jgi:hypothetical protein
MGIASLFELQMLSQERCNYGNVCDNDGNSNKFGK